MTRRRSGGLLLVVLFSVLGVGCNTEQNKPAPQVVAFPRSFGELAEKVTPAVVNISTVSTVTVPGSPFGHFFGRDTPEDFFHRFFGDIPDRELKQQSPEAGKILTPIIPACFPPG
jgi:serine protease Do